MKKFNYNVDPFQKVSANQKEKIKKILNDEVKYKELKGFEKFVFSKSYFIYEIILFIAIIGMIMLGIRSLKWKKKQKALKKNIVPSEIYKIAFEEEFNNVKILPSKTIPNDILLKNRGPGIPGDAKIIQKNFGPVFKIDKLSLRTSYVVWMWVRSNGKNTQVYYGWKIYLYTEQVLEKFKNMNLKMKKSNFLAKKGNDLENTKFNKGFWYKYSAPILARVFLPLSAQERWVEVRRNKAKMKYNKLRGFEINIKNGYYLFGIWTINKSNYGNTYSKRVANNKKDYIDNVYKNFEEDLVEIKRTLRLAIINKYFFK